MMNVRLFGMTCLSLLACLGGTSCASLTDPDALWPEDSTGLYQFGVSSGWAFVEADVELENGTGPLANPALGGNPLGASTTDLDPVFGLGLKFFYYVAHNWSIGAIIEHRIFDPESTRPLNADVDIDDFGTNHFLLDLRYVMDPIGKNKRWRPFVALQLGYVPEVEADGVVSYGDAFDGIGFPNQSENIELNGDDFFTAGAVAGAAYLLRDGLSLDMAVFYEVALDPTEDQLVLDPLPPGTPVFGSPSVYDGKLTEEGLYLSFGLSWYF